MTGSNDFRESDCDFLFREMEGQTIGNSEGASPEAGIKAALSPSPNALDRQGSIFA